MLRNKMAELIFPMILLKQNLDNLYFIIYIKSIDVRVSRRKLENCSYNLNFSFVSFASILI